jgi:hypothetical protein
MVRQLFNTIYRSTVTPVTYCTVGLSVYSRGYSDSVESILYSREITMSKYAINMVESAFIGYCVGIAYPIGIPASIGYLYLTET